MNPERNNNEELCAGGFKTTCWTAVETAGVESELALTTLEELLIRYAEPLKTHLVWKFQLTREEADDVFQDFVHQKMLLGNLLAAADRARGRFRTFLLTALDRFTLNWIRARVSKKRRPEKGWVPLSDLDIDTHYALEPDDPIAASWTSLIVGQALERMENECRSKGKNHRWEVFHAVVVSPILQEQKKPPLQDIARHHNLPTAAAVSNLVVTAKRMYQRILRDVIAQYSGELDQVDLEFSSLHRELKNSTCK